MNGKDKCEFLKGIRKRMAEANGIPYEPRECTFEGECTGTCPFCEKEAAELMNELKKKEAEGAEINTDIFSIEAIEAMYKGLGRISFHLYDAMVTPGICAELYEEGKQRLIELEKNNELEELQGSLMNSFDNDIEMPLPPIDPFRGSNNPLMAEKDLNELRQERSNKRSEPLMGDIDVEEYMKNRKMMLHQEEEDCTTEEMKEREKRGKGIANKVMNRIKNALESPLRGETDEE